MTECTLSSWVSSSRWRATGCSTSGLFEHSVQQFACTPQRIAPRGNRIIRDVTTSHRISQRMLNPATARVGGMASPRASLRKFRRMRWSASTWTMLGFTSWRDFQTAAHQSDGISTATALDHLVPTGNSLAKNTAASRKKSRSFFTRASSRRSRATSSSRGWPLPGKKSPRQRYWMPGTNAREPSDEYQDHSQRL